MSQSQETSSLGKNAPHKPQISDTIPTLHRYITGYDPKGSGQSVILQQDTGRWKHMTTHGVENNRGHNVLWSNSFPVDMNDDADIKAHEALQDKGTLGLIKPGGVVVRVVDFAPEYPGRMHITKSLDVGVVIEGTVEMVLDSGETAILERGDVVVQRATMHQWRNAGTGWARMLYVLQDAADVDVNGQKVNEAMAKLDPDIPRSGN